MKASSNEQTHGQSQDQKLQINQFDKLKLKNKDIKTSLTSPTGLSISLISEGAVHK